MIVRIAILALRALALLPTVYAQTSNGNTRYIAYTDPITNQQIYLDDSRQPALFTKDFGDCLGNSLVNVSRFDVAYYKDNSTVFFHLQGTSDLHKAAVMIYIGVYAYGKSRFDKPFNPCGTNIESLCPINSSLPISANGLIPIGPSDSAQIPDIALSIPDFEGEAILRIFSNATQSEIGCYSAQITNGGSFSQPAGVGSVLGLFTLVAVIASFATAAYGEVVPTMRLHYAHSLSVGVVFAVWQHIFFTGALSMNWPSVLVAWWSNFAWAAGMIFTTSMQQSISNLIGSNIGSTSSVGAAPANTNQDGVGGGYSPKQIYGRSLGLARRVLTPDHPLARDIASEIYGFDPERASRNGLERRDFIPDYSSGYKWYGGTVQAGLPLPGNYSGFAGTLAEEGIPISNAFMTGFLWLLIFLVIITGLVVLFKGILELFSRWKWIQSDRMAFFRRHWVTYTIAAALRTCFVAWFMIMFLAIFEFTFQSSAGVKAIAAIVFTVFLIGISAITIHACLYKAKRDGSTNELGEHKNGNGFLARLRRPRPLPQHEIESRGQYSGFPTDSKNSSKPFWKGAPSRMNMEIAEPPEYSVHDDDDYIMKFGWLASRYRRTKWWFFPYWLIYELIRACFYGGASGHPLVQVFGLLVVEVVAFVVLLWAKPFESRRLNILVVYLLGVSKIACVALSAAFDVRFNVDRIITTAIGIIIIVIQGVLMLITVGAIVIGAATSYMSLSRNADTFRPRKYANLRERYFDHLDRVVNDLPQEPKPKKEKKPKKVVVKENVAPPPPNFEMKTMRRMAKIDDDDDHESTVAEGLTSRTSLNQRPMAPYMDSRTNSRATTSPINRSRAASASSMSMSHGNLPFGARPHKASWSARDFDSWNKAENNAAQPPIDMSKNLAEDESVLPPTVPKHAHVRKNSRSSQHSQQVTFTNSESLQTGGDVSTRDMVGKVPQPAPRTRPQMTATTPDRNSNDVFSDDHDTQAGARRSGPAKLAALTPAQESEEFSGYFDNRPRR